MPHEHARTHAHAPTVELESAVRMHSTVRLRSCRLYPRERTQRQALHRVLSLCRLYRRMRHQSLPGHPASNILRTPSHSSRLACFASIHRLTCHHVLPNLLRQCVALWSHRAGCLSQLLRSNRCAARPSAPSARAWRANRAWDRPSCNEDIPFLWEGHRPIT